jgi:hypothetical protein
MAHFISLEDQTHAKGTAAAAKAKLFARILGALPTEITERIARKLPAKSDAADSMIRAVLTNLEEFSGGSVTIPDAIVKETNKFFRSTLRVLGKNSVTELL